MEAFKFQILNSILGDLLIITVRVNFGLLTLMQNLFTICPKISGPEKWGVNP